MNDRAYAADLCPHMPIDAGIVKAVRILRGAGIVTIESCEGGPGHVGQMPWVRFTGSQAEGWKALAAVATLDLPVFELRRVWTLDHGEPLGPEWYLVFREKL